MAQSVTIKGLTTSGDEKSPEVAVLEQYLNVLGTADRAQIAVSRGWYYGTGYYDSGVVDNGTLEILLRTGGATIQTSMLGGLLASGGDSLLEIFQAPTVIADGTSLGVLQVNQLSSNTNESVAFHTPTTSTDGTRIFRLFVPGGSGGNSAGGSSDPFQRLITLPSSDYLIRCTNVSGQAKPMSFNATWIEVPIGS